MDRFRGCIHRAAKGNEGMLNRFDWDGEWEVGAERHVWLISDQSKGLYAEIVSDFTDFLRLPFPGLDRSGDWEQAFAPQRRHASDLGESGVDHGFSD